MFLFPKQAKRQNPNTALKLLLKCFHVLIEQFTLRKITRIKCRFSASDRRPNSHGQRQETTLLTREPAAPEAI
jgi:hypothetical protein